MENPITKFREASSDARHRFLAENDFKPTTRNKLITGALAGLLAAASTAGASRAINSLVLKNAKIKIPLIPTAAVFGTSGAVAGYMAPTIAEKYRQDPKAGYNAMQKLVRAQSGIVDQNLEKMSSYYTSMIGSAGRAVGGALNYGVAKPIGWLAKNTFSRKMGPAGLIAKGAVGGGAIYGGMALKKRMTGPRSGGDYNTLLRNNVLAGNISPQELNPQDLQSVRSLGMR